MKPKSCNFKVKRPGRHFSFRISDTGISITVTCLGGGGHVSGDDAYKIKFIGRHASAEQLWQLRTSGFAEIATKAYLIFKQKPEQSGSLKEPGI